MLALSHLQLAFLAVAAALMGLSKTALPGGSTITIAVFAAVMPARKSTGVLLGLLVVGDLFALWAYQAYADWRTLRRIAPPLLAGVLIGTVFLAVTTDSTVRRTIGAILLALVVVTLSRRAIAMRRWNRPRMDRSGGTDPDLAGVQAADPTGRSWRGWLEIGISGVLAGFTTMVANAGGPVIALYFVAARFSINRFLGTAAWVFFAINLVKIPFSVSLGLISVESLRLDLLLAPAVAAGALLGRPLVRRINQRLFTRLVLIMTVVSSTYLLVR